MKRFLLSLVLVFLSINTLFAQRDTEHWIAPYYDSAGGYTNKIYLSTDSVTPFTVTVYNNNLPVGTATISKGAPAIYDVPNTQILATATTEGFKIINKGLYLKADKPFYCSLRLATSVHGEIITSKGKAGIGKEFYVASAPNTATSSIHNFTAGVMATENNTTVTATWSNASVTFFGGVATPGNTYTFTLNKGQSFIFAGTGSNAANLAGFIGAKIVSDKPITLTNGSCNGNFGLIGLGGSDPVLDQSVPVERLGNTFAIVKSRSTDPDQNMEGAIVIATQDNTEIFLNGSTTAAATINTGQWYRINESNYITQPGAGTHANMFISTSKNVYLYQLVAVGSSNATCGFNYIPPLNCFLPRKIDEIGNINQMPLSPNPTPSDLIVKLNILTETGATVLVNGTPTTPAQGPYPLTGNTNWVTYAIESITGNVTITSTKAVTAGINGGFSSAGYGGYFAGFSSIPVISKKTGECAPGIVLELDDGYETYQWFLNGVAIAGATANNFSPTQAGNYTVKVTMGTCPPVTTPIYKVYSCLKETNAAINACASKVITPTFTSSTQTPVGSTLTIITPPAHGTIGAINPTTGVFTYVPTPGYTGTDVIVYQFCGNGTEFIDCEKVTLTLTVVPFVLTDVTIKACQYNGKGFFDLTTAAVTLLDPVVKKFYPTLADLNADTNQIMNPTNYNSAAGDVYVRVTTNEGCTGVAKITLAFLPAPVVYEATLSECYIENNETKAEFDLTQANVTTATPVTKRFYPTFADASNGTNEITVNSTNFISSNNTVYVRVYNDLGCYAIAKITLTVIPPKRSTVLADKMICIDARTTLDAGPGYASYLWSTGETTQTISAMVGEYWVVLEDNGCTVKQLVTVRKAPEPVIKEIEISNNTATVIMASGKAPYKYAVDGTANWQDSNVFTGLSRGQHTFYVKDAYDCNPPVSVEITVPNLINAITPNGDNKNDYIDYSELSYKENLSFTVYDRYGNKVFKGDKFNNYRWDGKHFDKKLVTGTYWFHINWNEPNKDKTAIKYTGWILVKNIN